MSTVNQLSPSQNLSPAAMSPSEIARNENDIGALKNEFLTLMLAQMKNQDPMNPMDGAEYASQMAQFSTVEGIQNMGKLQQQNNNLIDSLQVLHTANLVGDKVSVPASEIKLSKEESLSGFVDMKTSAEEVSIVVRNSFGDVVKEINLGSKGVGRVDFEIPDLKEGSYQMDVIARNGDKETVSIPYLERRIDKVSIPGNGGDVQLSVSGIGNISLYSVNEFLGDNV